MKENWQDDAKYMLWSAFLSTIMFAWIYYTYLDEMAPDTWQFILLYGASLITGILGALIAMGITGQVRFEKGKWLRILVAPLIYTCCIFVGIFQDQLAQFDLAKSVMSNLYVLLTIFLLRFVILIVVRLF